MKYGKKIGVWILSICMMFTMFGITSQAASGSISLSSVSGKIGNTVTISGTAKCNSGAIGSAEAVFSYDPSALEFVGGSNVGGGAGSVSYAGYTSDGVATSLSFSMKFKILKEGKHTISTGGAEIYNMDEQQLSVSGGSATITGKAETSNSGGSGSGSGNSSDGNSGSGNSGSGNSGNGSSSGGNDSNSSDSDNTNDDVPVVDEKDTNNKLSSLKVSPGTIAPAFSANVTSYTVTVPADTTEVTISATAQSDKAKVSVSGGKNLKLGPNTAKVVVMAEDDSTKTYTITIMCGEIEKIQIGGVEHTINEGFADEQIPVGFTREKATYNGREYEALVHEQGNMRLMSLKNESGAEFYIYDQETQEFYSFTQIQIAEGKYIVPLPLNEEEDAFAYATKIVLDLQEEKIEAWQLEQQFSVICAMNQDGEELLYQYDKVDGTFQRYAEVERTEPVVDEKEETNQQSPLQDQYLYIIIGLAMVSVILLVAVVCLLATRKKNHSVRRRKLQKKLKKQEEV